ncbi:hypothetical protein NDU88_003590 [Pleurodeles waltl]|uniref:Uncharacterized protein n=1 Tax=Pleurodeles waltl TaxID=8319 RepID=A0AAV7M7F6_PLEWA|nr:hypothetical protein NDU88_003590 [Pleurodeles waltl]
MPVDAKGGALGPWPPDCLLGGRGERGACSPALPFLTFLATLPSSASRPLPNLSPTVLPNDVFVLTLFRLLRARAPLTLQPRRRGTQEYPRGAPEDLEDPEDPVNLESTEEPQA